MVQRDEIVISIDEMRKLKCKANMLGVDETDIITKIFNDRASKLIDRLLTSEYGCIIANDRDRKKRYVRESKVVFNDEEWVIEETVDITWELEEVAKDNIGYIQKMLAEMISGSIKVNASMKYANNTVKCSYAYNYDRHLSAVISDCRTIDGSMLIDWWKNGNGGLINPKEKVLFEIVSGLGSLIVRFAEV